MAKDLGQQQVQQEEAAGWADPEDDGIETNLTGGSENKQVGDLQKDLQSETPSQPTGDDDGTPSPGQHSGSQQAAEGLSDDSGKPQFEDDLLEMAGLTAEEAVKYFKTSEELENAISLQDSQSLWAGRASQQQQQQWQHPPQQQLPARHVPQQPPATSPPGQQAAPAVDLNNLDPEEWGEDTVNLLRGLDAQYRQQIQAALDRSSRAEQMLQQFANAQLQQQIEAQYDEFDQRVNSLPEQYREAFGSGTRHTLGNSPQMQNRIRLNQAMQIMSRGRQMNGLPPLGRDQLFKRALRAEFPELQEQSVRREVNDKLSRRYGMQTSRPSARQGSALTPDEKAAHTVGEYLNKAGIQPWSGPADEQDGI